MTRRRSCWLNRLASSKLTPTIYTKTPAIRNAIPPMPLALHASWGGNYASEVAGAQVFLGKIAPLLSSQSFADYYALSDSASAAAKVLSQSVATIDPSRLSAVSSLAETLSESITKIQGPALQAAISQLAQNAIPSGLTTSLLASAALAREQSNPLEDDDEEKGQGESHDRDSSESEESSEEERKEGFD